MSAITKGTYSVTDPDDSARAVDWSWPDPGSHRWTMSLKDGVRWEGGDPLTEEGRKILLAHFEIEDQADDLPLAAIETLSPHDLEERCTKEHEPHVSTCVGSHIEASAVL